MESFPNEFSIRIVMFKVMSEPNDEFPCCASVFFMTLQVGDSQSCIVALCSTQYVCAGKTIQTQLILTLKLNGDVFFFLDFFVLRSLGRLNFFSRKD